MDVLFGSKVVVKWFALQIGLRLQQLAAIRFLVRIVVDGNKKKFPFFKKSSWTMTKALCLNPMAA